MIDIPDSYKILQDKIIEDAKSEMSINMDVARGKPMTKPTEAEIEAAENAMNALSRTSAMHLTRKDYAVAALQAAYAIKEGRDRAENAYYRINNKRYREALEGGKERLYRVLTDKPEFNDLEGAYNIISEALNEQEDEDKFRKRRRQKCWV